VLHSEKAGRGDQSQEDTQGGCQTDDVSRSHAGEHELFLSQSRSRSRSRSQQQRHRQPAQPQPEAQRRRSRSRSPSTRSSRSRSEAIPISSNGNNEDASKQSSSQEEDLAALLAENEYLDQLLRGLRGSTPDGGEAAPVFKGVGGKSGGSWLLEGACPAGRCLCLACRGTILRLAALSSSKVVPGCSQKTIPRIGNHA